MSVSSLGAIVQSGGVAFEVWAPEARSIEVVLLKDSDSAFSLKRSEDGKWRGLIPGIKPGDLYFYRIDGDRCLPDPASRFQPQGVHGPSQIIDSNAFQWSDQNWRGIPIRDLIFYELHVGAFTPEGTFRSATERLSYLADLGVTAIELMPVGDFPGSRNWGYDGVDLFAPARCYGSPDDFQKLVDRAHGLGLAVFLDVVYNHFGPDGAYAPSFSRYYFTDRHKTPWGDAINLDGIHSKFVREFFIENALYWIHDFHLDGLRLDATHAMIDDSRTPFVAELTKRLHESGSRNNLVIAEDHRNLARMIMPAAEGGWGLDAVWSDDFHHQMHVLLTGERQGYYIDFSGKVEDIAATLNQGWFFCGQHSKYFDGPRGSDPAGMNAEKFVIFLQNHDQVGNRAFGDRLHHQTDLAVYRAASTLLLCAGNPPLLFMGQEWAASTPFCYFTDHNEELGRSVTNGRRNEFARFSAFSDPALLQKIPDPQALNTFEQSRLSWDENRTEPFASILRLYKNLITLRKTELLQVPESVYGESVTSLGEHTLLLRHTGNVSTVFVVVHLKDSATVTVEKGDAQKWEVLLTTEDSTCTSEPMPITIEPNGSQALVHFFRPGAAVLRVV